MHGEYGRSPASAPALATAANAVDLLTFWSNGTKLYDMGQALNVRLGLEEVNGSDEIRSCRCLLAGFGQTGMGQERPI